MTKRNRPCWTAITPTPVPACLPGAINNPGIAAILAAAQPADTDYTYFVTSSDGATFLYASDYRTHLANCEQVGITTG